MSVDTFEVVTGAPQPQPGDLRPASSMPRASEVEKAAARYVERSPELAGTLEPLTQIIASAERDLSQIRQRYADSPEGRKLRAERVERAHAALDKLVPADPDGELARIEDHTLGLERLPDGSSSYVQRRPDDELRRTGSARQSGIWAWFLALPPTQQARTYLDAIDNGDAETVQAVEMMPAAMSPLTADTKAAGRARKLQKLPQELQAGLEAARARLTAVSAVSIAARRALSEMK